ncbi:flagellar brake protein [Alcaligenes endophyticus]|uniref:Flagellar brake protein YcgR n=1 Tax=Alcaligenes endophyticus TaxID=1929088 RepID=A0ABT8EMB3_9BURK|nr:flagellar brake protein [Alcaligenes endophyticus]MCX5590981.1 flagellar brake protein [Alcaligenes endophyticus]MDN4122442.1 flagellar brake protein [Alcaligenes endophyticus]
MDTSPPRDDTASDDDALFVRSQLEILQILRKIQKTQSLLHISCPQENRGVVTTILSVDTNTFIIDAAPDDNINAILQRSASNQLQTHLEKILISFKAGPASPCMFEKKPALSLPIPSTVHRLQRRRFYRVNVPVSNPATVSFKLGIQEWSFPLHDINAGGMAIHDDTLSLDAQAGILVRDARLHLPGIGDVNLDVLFVRTQDQQLESGRPIRRIGCTFLNLSGQAQMNIQGYITHIERQEIARRKGFL